MKLTILDAATNEIHDAAAYYHDISNSLSGRFLTTITSVLEQIETSPLRFGHLETLPDAIDVRRALIPGFPYYIPFRVMRDEILVLAIAHGSREPNYWIGRLHKP